MKNKNQSIEIKKASKNDYWYSKYIGGIYPVVQEDAECYIVRTPSGYSNMVLKSDSEVVENES